MVKRVWLIVPSSLAAAMITGAFTIRMISRKVSLVLRGTIAPPLPSMQTTLLAGRFSMTVWRWCTISYAEIVVPAICAARCGEQAGSKHKQASWYAEGHTVL